ncbi:DJ-1/PfpI family protein [Metabacillus sp. GX 13764]|uniref:DJ-1/PfpI family protein n=1 Tax=Metabacillus kandeliae TaxID=2900151 RepID=UPI001E38D390|nr:DJ-1/PfpI family protein [Metabacillus kandeliae]MCD7034105.1 DJ-1/PfpI family protein [Metabacillus kandeliae]
MKKLFRYCLYFAIIFLPLAAIGLTGASEYADSMYGSKKAKAVYQPSPPPHDSSKPTVAILLGSRTTEVIDFLAPYELLSSTKAFNVYAVSSQNQAVSLSGSLDVLPHYTFSQLDQLLGKSPDVIVVPYIFHMDDKAYEPVDAYLRKHAAHAGTILSICGGAVNVAKAGLLNGKSAATHWSRIGNEMKNYPAVNWVRDRRFVEDGKYISSAGLTSGIDATLYLISKMAGEQKAAEAAREINYTGTRYLQDTSMKPYYSDAKDVPYYLNIAFSPKKKIGVLLYEGMQETALASVYDTYPASGTSKAVSVSRFDAPVKTKHQLSLLPRYSFQQAPALDHIYIPGTNAITAARNQANRLSAMQPKADFTYLHAREPKRFVLEPPLEDLARETNNLTANYAAKRLEYRENAVALNGSPVQVTAAAIPLASLLLSLLLIASLEWRRKRKKLVQ